MKKILLPFALLFFLFFLLLFPSQAFSYAKAGLMLWFYTLLPSLLPFMILSNICIKTGLLDKLFEAPKKFWKKAFALSPSGAYALCMGIFCGYPMGAKITADLYAEHRISKQEASYLLTFACFPGPSFLSSYLCVGLFKNTRLIFPTYFILYSSGFLCSLLFRPQKSSEFSYLKKTKKEISGSDFLGNILDTSIMNGFETITKLGGYILIFSILQGIFSIALRSFPTLGYFLQGITEITTGNAALSKASWSFDLIYPLILAFTSFGGLSVAAQTKSMLANTDLPFSSYLKGKICSFFCTFAIAFCLVKIVKVII